MPRGIHISLALAALLIVLPSCSSSRHATTATRPHASPSRQYSPSWQKGVSFPSWSHDRYLQPASLVSLDQLAGLKATWVAIVPTWYMQTKRSNTIEPETGGGTASDESVRYIIQQAHARGLKVMLKPHVDSRDGTWRGSITPKKPREWFQSYRTFILHYAQMAAETGVEQLSVGCELKTMSGPTYSDEWRSIVSAVRAAYSGPLTYAANWGHVPDAEYLRLEWWDVLDHIGVDAFFPLTTVLSPTVEQVKSGWFSYTDPWSRENHWMDELKAQSDRFGKPILFTEIGYDSRPNGADVWYTSGPSTPDMQTQQNCVEAALQAWDQRSWIAGVFWWNWNTDPNRGGTSDTGMDLNNKPAAATITDWFGRPFTEDVTPPSTPEDLSAQPLSTSQIRLTWSAAEDNVAVTGYRVYRNGSAVGTTASTSYTDSGLAEGTTYQYQVSAYDAAGNESPLSAAVPGTTGGTGDTQAPSVPTGLTVTGTTSTAISLQWNASTDNVGVVGYHVFRDGGQVGSPTGTSYTDSGLAPSTTYSYQVRAVDAAGNLSELSSAVNGTTAGTAPQGYGFEDGTTQGWTRSGTCTAIWSANGIRYEGAYSIGLRFQGTTNKQPGYATVVPLTSLIPGSTVTLRIYLAGSYNRVTARAFAEDAAGRISRGGRTSLVPGQWVEVSVSVPSTATAPLSLLGIEVTTRNGTYTGDVYLDDVRW